MSEKSESRVTIREFLGLESNRGPFVGKPGTARSMKNLRGYKPGSLRTRGGLRPLKFES